MGQTATQQRRAEILRDINLVRAKRREVLTGGTSISISGGSSVSNATLAELAKEEQRLLRSLFLLDGQSTRTIPDFSGESTPTVIP